MVTRLSLFLFVLIALAAGLAKGWHTLRDGFDIRRISHCQGGRTEETPAGLLPILNQPFTYLSRGRQSFTFASEDGKYVLKLPRSDRPKLSLWRKWLLPRSSWAGASNHFARRRQFALNSFQIAMNELKEETGMVYLHLEKTEGLPTVQITDSIGRKYWVPLDETLFFVQKRFTLAFPILKRYISRPDRNRIQIFLDEFLLLAAKKAKKGIFNKDSTFFLNFGVDGDHLYQLDVGCFHHMALYQGAPFFPAFMEAVTQLKPWLKECDGETLEWLDKRVEEYLAQNRDSG